MIEKFEELLLSTSCDIGGYKLTYGTARKILHPDTTLQALAEIEYHAGFSGREARIKAVDEACLLACEVLDKMIPTPITHEATLRMSCTCPNCKNVIDRFEVFGENRYRVTTGYCWFCGQALDWDAEKK